MWALDHDQFRAKIANIIAHSGPASTRLTSKTRSFSIRELSL